MKIIIPGIILLLQIIGFLFMYDFSKRAHPDAPVGFVLIHFYAICNLLVLILSYFLFFKVEKKCSLWIIPIAIAILNIIVVIIMQILMAIGEL